MRVDHPKNKVTQTESSAVAPPHEATTGTPPLQARQADAAPKPQSLPRQRLADLPLLPELMTAVATTCERFRLVTTREQSRVAEEFKLQYYYGGRDVACLDTSEGRFVVAVGTPILDNLPEILQSLPADERRQLAILSPEPWGERTVLVPSVEFDEA